MKVTGRNGNSIFLPPTGYGLPMSGPIGQTQITNANDGYYWVGESYKDSYGRFGYIFYITRKAIIIMQVGMLISLKWQLDLLKSNFYFRITFLPLIL